MRKSWDEYFIDIAFVVASRSTCPRRHVGAVLVRDKRIISTGYNGSAPGAAHCEDVGCLMSEVYGGKGCIRTTHAERNALEESWHIFPRHCTLYTTDFPCINCALLIADSRSIVRVVYSIPYDKGSEEVLNLFKKKGIVVEQLVSSSMAESSAVNRVVEGSSPS